MEAFIFFTKKNLSKAMISSHLPTIAFMTEYQHPDIPIAIGLLKTNWILDRLQALAIRQAKFHWHTESC